MQDTYEDENGDLQNLSARDDRTKSGTRRRRGGRPSGYFPGGQPAPSTRHQRHTQDQAGRRTSGHRPDPFTEDADECRDTRHAYSPIGLAWTALKNGVYDAMTENGTKFDQRKFVMNMGRGLTERA